MLEDSNVWRRSPGSGWRDAFISFFWAGLFTCAVFTVGGRLIYKAWWEQESARRAAIEAAQAYERVVAAAPLGIVPVGAAAHGRDLFITICVACHGPSGTGMAGLGKNLVESDFVAALGDEGLVQFLIEGRPDARPVAMPPRAGREDLTGEDLQDLAVYLRGLQDPRRLPELPAPQLALGKSSESEMAGFLDAAGGDAELAEYIANGARLFGSTCIACHGPGGVGLKGNGKALRQNTFVQSLDNDGLLAFIKSGRSPSDPANTTGIQMPSRGGNPALSDDDLLDIIDYLRTLQGAQASAAGGASTSAPQ
jgi:disulfide bond formation protein DsbB